MYWFSVLAGSVSTDHQEKIGKRQTGALGRAYHDPETANSILLAVTYNAGLPLQWYARTYICVLVQRSSRFREYRPARERTKEDRQGLRPGVS